MKRRARCSADVLATVVQRYVHGMEDEELLEEFNRVRGLTEVNCYWVAYGLRGLLLDLIENEVRIRRHQEIMAALTPAEVVP